MADNKLIDILIVSPNGTQYDNQGKIVVLNAIDGLLGIMAGHEPLVTPLGIGEVRVKRGEDDNEVVDKIAVNGGFLEFVNNTATVVADSAEKRSDIDIERAKLAKERAEKHLREAKKLNDVKSQLRAEVALSRALNRINVYGED